MSPSLTYDYRRHRRAGKSALEALRAVRADTIGRTFAGYSDEQRAAWQRQDATRHRAIDYRIARYGY